MDTSSNRTEVRTILTKNIQALDARIQATREAGFTTEDEQLQLKRLRTLAQLSRQYRMLARDDDVDEMESQLRLITEAVERADSP